MATTASANLSFLPQETGDLVVRPVIEEASATRVSTVITTGGNSYRIPLILTDPQSAWVAEGAEIPPGDPSLGEIVVTFSKLAGLCSISNELLADASPEASKLVGDGIARDLAVRLDDAYFKNATTADGPPGIKGQTTSVVSAGGSWVNADPFTEAVFTAAGLGATLGAFVANPADCLLLTKVKELTAGSNRPLLQPDVTQPGQYAIAGVPLIADPSVVAGEVWGIAQSRSYVILRSNPTVVVDSSCYFTSDRSAVRTTMRVGFAWPQPLALIKVTKA